MEHEIRQAFASIQAGEALKARTRQQLHKRYAHRSVSVRGLARPLFAAAACCLLALGLASWRLFFTVTSVISIDINPSLELSVNRFDRIIAVEGYNPDGEALADGLQLLYKRYTQAVDEILTSETVTACLADNGALSITVVQNGSSQSDEILAYVSHCAASTPNVHCHAVQQQDAEAAHELGLSCGKYPIYQEICRYTDALTPEQANLMSMRELRELLTVLESDAGVSPSQSSGGHHRHGHSG